ncbi:S1 family peptidase [Candidatus Neptunichlamydia sp. REUL1]|uniref:S1 family peptidase n=1 Tax=Candidatus Neptunichlamydia sp. REUL1 TaxID=3064277 RepID=UPI00292DED1B|nr:serine protease [Candidatus Neptunochlamydia sp. REUL1]
MNLEKLDLKTIFSEIGKNACCVYASDTKSSGILLGGRRVLVTLHSVAPICGEERRYHEFVTIQHKDKAYLAKWSGDNDLKKAEYYDCCFFNVVDEKFPEITPIPTLSEDIDPGEEVYFAGYPLNQEDPSFHKGTVSSYTNREGLSYFHIDASILPGNSGGPVFIEKDKTLYLAGVIFAELASIDSAFIRERELISNRLSKATISVGGVDTNKVVLGIMNTVFDNLSTGIGKVVCIKHAFDVLKEGELPDAETPFHLGFPIGRKKQYKLFKEDSVQGAFGGEQSYWIRRPNRDCPGIIIDNHQKKHITDWIGKVKQSGSQFPAGFTRDQLIELVAYLLKLRLFLFVNQNPGENKTMGIQYVSIESTYQTQADGPPLRKKNCPYVAIHFGFEKNSNSWVVHVHPDDGKNAKQRNSHS